MDPDFKEWVEAVLLLCEKAQAKGVVLLIRDDGAIICSSTDPLIIKEMGRAYSGGYCGEENDG